MGETLGQRSEARYQLNVNPDGLDVLHRDASERCNVDDAQGMQAVDPMTAASLLDAGLARRCEHCWPDEAA